MLSRLRMNSSATILAAAVLVCGSVYADVTVDTAQLLGPVKPMHGVKGALELMLEPNAFVLIER